MSPSCSSSASHTRTPGAGSSVSMSKRRRREGDVGEAGIGRSLRPFNIRESNPKTQLPRQLTIPQKTPQRPCNNNRLRHSPIQTPSTAAFAGEGNRCGIREVLPDLRDKIGGDERTRNVLFAHEDAINTARVQKGGTWKTSASAKGQASQMRICKKGARGAELYGCTG
ncbi:hypothetical protein SKAU_G00027880 [Synaphobranchus kaupii]|uniref:Uncharacterized protein n=1 Tax=Synaphobranchus kaupii TaxID=118154 RepID=A0A9Q1GD67_SYNKA|nr:hypothetical protein SKAU_G00027880 [Synaphobranchus kaupii]